MTKRLTRRRVLGVGALAAALLAACGDGSDDFASQSIDNSLTPRPSGTPAAGVQTDGASGEGGNLVTTPSGLQYEDVVVGTGVSPRTGQTAVVHYTGTLTDGTKFDSSRDRNQPLSFRLGVGEVIKGWDEGVATMKVGGRRKLVIPPALGYGAAANGPIPANSTLLFDVELLEVRN